MSKSSKKVIAVTMGDPRGIGAEIIRKALKPEFLGPQGFFIVIGDGKKLGRLPSKAQVIDVPYASPGEGAIKFLDKAIAFIKAGEAQALVTAPLSKEAVNRHVKVFGPQAGHSQLFVGHTEYLARAFDVKNFDMMFAAKGVFLTIVTRHVALKEVPRLITRKKVFDSIVLMNRTLKDKFKLRRPAIAVLGLNPHAGEGGLLGSEDTKQILPAVKQANALGIQACGPLPADTFFAFPIGYDGIVAMYHDQGLAPFKGLYMKELVNFTAGLPFVRTSPAHGTAFDITGQNKADPSSMIAAIRLACRCA